MDEVLLLHAIRPLLIEAHIVSSKALSGMVRSAMGKKK